MENYYAVLGVTETASDEQIKQTYRILAKKYHPDLHPGDQAAARKFAQINEAMAVIGDPEKRKAYDTKRTAQQNRSATARAAAAHPGAATRTDGATGPVSGMSQGARQAYANSAAGALQAINDAYRRGYDAGVAAASQQRNVAVDTWKKSAESWQKEAENRAREIDALRRELDAARRNIAEEQAEADRLETALRAQIAKARDTRLDVEAEAATAADLRETLEGRIRELENTLHDYENKLNVERESRKYSDADKVRLSRELVRMREELAEAKEENGNLRARLQNRETPANENAETGDMAASLITDAHN